MKTSSQLTPDELRDAVAKRWPEVVRHVGFCWQWFDGSFWSECHESDPLADLNCVAAMEATLTEEQQEDDYIFELCDVVLGFVPDAFAITKNEARRLANATPTQRLTALLMTK